MIERRKPPSKYGFVWMVPTWTAPGLLPSIVARSSPSVRSSTSSAIVRSGGRPRPPVRRQTRTATIASPPSTAAATSPRLRVTAGRAACAVPYHRSSASSTSAPIGHIPPGGRRRARPLSRPVVPEVSVVIAAYNQARWVGEAIASVRAQTFVDWELVVVDDGSTDATSEVVARHADDARIRCLRQAHAERAAARNRGIAATAGPLVAFLDADDWWLPKKLERQVAALAAAPEAAFCYTPARFVDEARRPLPLRQPARATAGHVSRKLLL